MRIVVVEDEAKPREGLVRLISRLDPSYQIVGQARNGIEGREIAARVSPDLVITDIKMPGVDGLEMIRSLRNDGCSSTFVILSGYAEFDYARQGIELGVRDYLLKPITAKTIGDVLKKIAGDSRHGGGAQQPQRLDAGALVLFDCTERALDAEKHLPALVRKSSELAGARGFVLAAHPDPSSFLFHVSLASGFDRLVKELEIEIRAEKERFLRMGLLCAACVFPGDGDPGSLARALARSLRWSMLVGPLTVIHSDRIARTAREEPEYPAMIESAALDALRRGDSGKLSEAVTAFRSFSAAGRSSPDRLEEIMFRFFFTVANALKEIDYPRFRAVVEKNLLQRVEDFRSKRDLDLIFDDFASSMSAATPVVSAGAHSLPVRQAINYVRNGFRGAISLEEAAGQIGLTPEYLSSLFLKETGRNFSAFVTDLRIEDAKRLLASRGARIFEVAQKVGITDPRYFCRVFRKHTGLSPREYARLHS